MDSNGFDYRLALRKNFQERKAKNSAYGLRAFARDLKISPTALSQVLSEKRNFSKKNALTVAEKLGFTPGQIDAMLITILAIVAKDRDENVHQLLEDEFCLISEWYHLAILSMAKTGKVKWDAGSIAKTLGLKECEVLLALERLERLQLLVKKTGKLKRSAQPIRTTLDIPSSAIKKYHRENLKLVEHALDEIPVHLREISSMTLNIGPDQMPEAKKLIVDFKRKFSKKIECDQGDNTYTLGVHFYPASLAKPEDLND